MIAYSKCDRTKEQYNDFKDDSRSSLEAIRLMKYLTVYRFDMWMVIEIRNKNNT